jgi:hypothetical protein
MRGGYVTRSFTLGIVGLALATSACATSPSAYRDRDEPINRTTGEGQQYRGTVARVDEPQQVVVLDNGQMYRVSGDRAVLVNGQPVVLSRVQPGMPATIVAGTPVVYQNGQYVAVAAPGTVVATPSNVIRTYGRVADIDRDGTVKIKMANGRSFDFVAPPGTVLRQGDAVAIDMTFGAAAPSALPR